MKFVLILFFPTLFTALNFADLEGGLILISLIVGVITFLLIKKTQMDSIIRKMRLKLTI